MRVRSMNGIGVGPYSQNVVFWGFQHPWRGWGRYQNGGYDQSEGRLPVLLGEQYHTRWIGTIMDVGEGEGGGWVQGGTRGHNLVPVDYRRRLFGSLDPSERAR